MNKAAGNVHEVTLGVQFVDRESESLWIAQNSMARVVQRLEYRVVIPCGHRFESDLSPHRIFMRKS